MKYIATEQLIEAIAPNRTTASVDMSFCGYPDNGPNGPHPEWTQSRRTQSRLDTIPNGHHPEWISSRIDTIPNEHLQLYSYFGV